jgi:hypothetical protein
MTDTESAPGVSLLSPFCQDTAHGRELRERVIRGETAAAEGTVPIQFWPVLVAAKADDKVLSNTEFNKVNRRHTRGEFRRAVRGMANGSAPGKSGLSYAELKCMSDDMLDLLSDLCNISVESGVVFSDWCEEIVYMIPKESGVDLLEKQRPLKLQEALRKVTVGIKKNRMAKLWHKFDICDESQYAFLKGRSTIQPAMIKRLLLERARYHGLSMVVADIDFNKAYDSIDRHIKEMALRRLGIGYVTIDYLLEFDRRNVQRVRTYYGDSETFGCERGTRWHAYARFRG